VTPPAYLVTSKYQPAVDNQMNAKLPESMPYSRMSRQKQKPLEMAFKQTTKLAGMVRDMMFVQIVPKARQPNETPQNCSLN
jgi:hypothetical protein